MIKRFFLNREPLLILFVCFILGVFLQDGVGLEFYKIAILVSISALLIVFSYVFKKSWWRNFGIQFLFFSLGIFSCFQHFSRSPNFILPDKDELIFKINKKLNSNEKNRRYEVEILDKAKSINAVLSIPKIGEELDNEHYYKAFALIHRIEGPQYNYQFDYQKYMQREGVFYQLYIPGEVQKSIRSDLSFSEKVKTERWKLLSIIDKNNDLEPKSKALLKGIILADRTEMHQETVTDFNKTGLVHLLAISGSHMVLIFWLFFYCLSKVLSSKKWVVLTSLIFIWIFTIFIDYGNSVVRSSIMITMYYGFVLLNRKPDLLHSMSLAGLIILIADPYQVFDVGFQLSFCAVFGIYWLNKPILKSLPHFNTKVGKYFLNIISITLSAQIATLPLVIFYFHQFPLISLLANLVAIPLAEVVIILSLLMAILFEFGVDFHFLNIIYDFFALIFLDIVHFFAGFNSLLVKNIPMNIVEVLVLFILIYQLRFVLLKFNLKNCNIMIIGLLSFSLMRFGFNIVEYNKIEILEHKIFKEQVFSWKQKDKIIFWVKENTDRIKAEKYIINPYLVSKRLDQYEIRYFDKDNRQIKIGNYYFSVRN